MDAVMDRSIMTKLIKCDHFSYCRSAGTQFCEGCKNNKRRNYRPNLFEPATDLVAMELGHAHQIIPILKNLPNGHLQYIVCPVCNATHTALEKLHSNYICSECGMIFDISKEMLREINDEDPLS